MKKNQQATKPATVSELIALIDVSNKAHEFARQMGALKPGLTVKNPLLDALYIAATNAAISLQPLMVVTVATQSPINAEAQRTQRPEEKP